jgi:hypothetical protein
VEPSFAPVEQSKTELVLCMAQHFADRWLGDVQIARSRADRALSKDVVEDLDMP